MMKTGRGRTHYWDTSVFLHWLSDKVKVQSVIDGVEEMVRLSEREDLTIFTSTITRIEVLNGHFERPEDRDRFEALFPRAVEYVNVTPPIARLAHDVRDYYHSRVPSKKLKTADCIHIATAIANTADEMNALDKPDMLSLNGDVLNGRFKLRIVAPSMNLPPLFRAMPFADEELGQ